MRFKFFGTEIYISFLFCAVLCLMLCFDRTGLLLLTLPSVAIHETGHLFIMYITGSAPVSIRLIPASVQITEKPFLSDKNAAFIALAGPVFNLCIALTAYLNYNIYKKEAILEFSAVNLLLFIFNMLPVSGLDGGTLLKIALTKIMRYEKADITLKLITLIFSLLCLFSGIVFYIKKIFNPSVFILSLYFFICALLTK